MLTKLMMMGVAGLSALGLGTIFQGAGPEGGPPPPKAKKKADRGPGNDLQRAYDLLRRLRADVDGASRPEERLRDWTRRATKLYRQGMEASLDGNDRLVHEYGTAAHDLARAVDHARNAARLDRSDPELPAPPSDEEAKERLRRDLTRAFDRIREARGQDVPEGKFYLDAARDLYLAANRDAEAQRFDRASELARAAEAMTHVPEHLAHAMDEPLPPSRTEPKPDRKRDRPAPPRRDPRRPAPSARGRLGLGDELPPPVID